MGSGTSAVSGTQLCDGEDPDRNVAGYKNLGSATDLADCTSKCQAYSGAFGCNSNYGCTSVYDGQCKIVKFTSSSGSCWGYPRFSGKCDPPASGKKTYSA